MQDRSQDPNQLDSKIIIKVGSSVVSTQNIFCQFFCDICSAVAVDRVEPRKLHTGSVELRKTSNQNAGRIIKQDPSD